MSDFDAAFAPFAQRMAAAQQPSLAIDTFRHYYAQLRGGATGLIAEPEIAPVDSLPSAEMLAAARPTPPKTPAEIAEVDYAAAGRSAMGQAVVIKLNGGLGTSMGMTRAKPLLTAKDGLSFLDIIARQILHLRRTHACGLPLVLMNSFRTRADSLAALQGYGALPLGDLPLDFVQHQVPKVRAVDLNPATFHDDAYTWCPPGHGDIYTALVTSGMLDTLLERGARYAFVSNADNLGAVMDLPILGYFAHHGMPFLMEVCDRTEADKKGGHLARRRSDGGLILRESAQCPAEDSDTFQDFRRHRFFNTNNLWIDLVALKALLSQRGGVLGLPMIRNQKSVDPADPSTDAVFQLETAMGAAIAVFDGAGAIRVPRSRFAPVKTTNDLLGLWSDNYVRDPDECLVVNPARDPSLGSLLVDLDSAHYKFIGQLQAHFPRGAPSLVGCTRLEIDGAVTFGADVTIRGAVKLHGPMTIADGAVLAG